MQGRASTLLSRVGWGVARPLRSIVNCVNFSCFVHGTPNQAFFPGDKLYPIYVPFSGSWHKSGSFSQDDINARFSFLLYKSKSRVVYNYSVDDLVIDSNAIQHHFPDYALVIQHQVEPRNHHPDRTHIETR